MEFMTVLPILIGIGLILYIARHHLLIELVFYVILLGGYAGYKFYIAPRFDWTVPEFTDLIVGTLLIGRSLILALQLIPYTRPFVLWITGGKV